MVGGLCRAPQKMLVAQRSYHLEKAGQRSFGEEVLARGLVYLLVMHCIALGHTYALLVK